MGWTAWERVVGDGLDFDEIVYEKKRHEELGGGVARITINKPEKFNAMTLQTVDEMFRAFYDANHDPLARRHRRRRRGQALRHRRRRRMGALGAARGLLLPLPAQPADPHLAQARDRAGAGLLPRRPQPHGLLLRLHDRRRRRRASARPGRKVSSPADGFFVPYLTKVVGAKKAREMWMLCRRYTAEPGARDGPRERGRAARRISKRRSTAGARRCCASRPGCLEILKASFDQDDGRLRGDGRRSRAACTRTGSTRRKARKAAPPSSRSASRASGRSASDEAEMRRRLIEDWERKK